MDKDIIFKTFPATREEALAMLYLQQQDISDISPEELVEMYFRTLDSIKLKVAEIKTASRQAHNQSTYF